MATLDGTGRRVDLGRGITVSAPGLRGSADVHDVGPTSPTRAGDVDGSGVALAQALERSDVRRIRVITLDVAGTPVPSPAALRTPTTNEDGLVVEVPDLGPDVAQVLLAVDEAGVTTWNFPVDSGLRPAPTTRGTGDTVRFVVRTTTPPPDERTATRGLLGALGRKVFELLTIPLAEAAVPPVARAAADAWERRARHTRVRPFTPDDYRLGEVADLDDAGWQTLAGGRSLWFVHGTFSTAHGAFSGLPVDVVSALHGAYGGRVVAFDHLTLGVDPVGNVAALADLVPVGLHLEADVVAHSRGGAGGREVAPVAPGQDARIGCHTALGWYSQEGSSRAGAPRGSRDRKLCRPAAQRERRRTGGVGRSHATARSVGRGDLSRTVRTGGAPSRRPVGSRSLRFFNGDDLPRPPAAPAARVEPGLRHRGRAPGQRTPHLARPTR